MTRGRGNGVGWSRELGRTGPRTGLDEGIGVGRRDRIGGWTVGVGLGGVGLGRSDWGVG